MANYEDIDGTLSAQDKNRKSGMAGIQCPIDLPAGFLQVIKLTIWMKKLNILLYYKVLIFYFVGLMQYSVQK